MAPAPGVVLGVDGGGTKTIAIVADVSGQVLGAGRSGNCDIYNNPGAIDEVALAVARAAAAAGVTTDDIAAGAFSLCGCDWPEDFVYWQQALAARAIARQIRVVNDAVGALSSDVPDGNAIAIICGTGGATGARNAAGDVWHSSFWQLRQGGHEMSLAVLNAIYRAELGIDPPTAMTPRALALFGIDDVEEMLHVFTGRGQVKPATTAGLVPILFDEAEAGDAAANRIIADFGAAYAEIALAAARKVEIVGKPASLLLAGGVFRHPSRLLRRRVVADLSVAIPALTLVPSRSEPVKGAVTIALQMAGVALAPEIEARLAETLPPPEFFHTHVR